MEGLWQTGQVLVTNLQQVSGAAVTLCSGGATIKKKNKNKKTFKTLYKLMNILYAFFVLLENIMFFMEVKKLYNSARRLYTLYRLQTLAACSSNNPI